MTIAPIASVPALPSLPSPAAAASEKAGSGDAFSNIVTNAVDALQQSQATASTDETQAAAGQGNLADTMIAASQASLDTEVTSDLLDKALGSYDSIMNMSF